MVFSWFTNTNNNNITQHDEIYTKELYYNNKPPLLEVNEEDGWVQILTSQLNQQQNNKNDDNQKDIHLKTSDPHHEKNEENEVEVVEKEKEKEKEKEEEKEKNDGITLTTTTSTTITNNDNDNNDNNKENLLPMPKKISRQERRYQERKARQDQKKKMASEQRKKQQLFLDKITNDHSCLPPRSAMV
ncbi:unnamed protein product [Cunninghamella echinulata]